MYRKYYSYNDMPVMPKLPEPEEVKPKPSPRPPEKKESGLFSDGKLFGKFETDDIILIVIVLILLMDECDDKMLLLALAFIFFSG